MSIMMPQVPLDSLLTECKRITTIQPQGSYRLLGIRNYAQGLYVRETKLGSNIRANNLYRVHKGDFVYSRLSAGTGGFALAGDNEHNCFVSNEFPCFQVNLERLNNKYLAWYFGYRLTWSKAVLLSYGTGRNRLAVDEFLKFTIPLPSLEHQHQIVSKIEGIACKVNDAIRLQKYGYTETDNMLSSTMRKLFSGISYYKVVPIEDVCLDIIDCLHSNPIYSDEGIPTVRSPDVGWGKLLLQNAKKTSEEEYIRRTRRGELKPGDIIVVREGGGTGKAGIVEEGQRVSLGQRVMQLSSNQDKVLPKFLLFQWLSPLIQQDQLAECMKGSASPHLNIRAMKRFNFILPSLEEQRCIIAYLEELQAKVDRLKALQIHTVAELDALLPSILDEAFYGGALNNDASRGT